MSNTDSGRCTKCNHVFSKNRLCYDPENYVCHDCIRERFNQFISIPVIKINPPQWLINRFTKQ